jgi:hypothetical protein
LKSAQSISIKVGALEKQANHCARKGVMVRRRMGIKELRISAALLYRKRNYDQARLRQR